MSPTPRRERCAIAGQRHIETLNDLFAALFRPEEGQALAIRQPVRPLREELFALFFPDALVMQYADKSKSNLTWFFTSDARNKSVRRSLIALLRQDARATVDDAHRKCRAALWPQPGVPAFDGEALRAVLGRVRLPAALNGRFHIVDAGDGVPSQLDRFYRADEAAALSRLLLTLAVAGDAPVDVMGEIWRGDNGDHSFMRGDGSPEGNLRYCRMLDLQGRHDRAFEGYIRIAKQLGRPAETLDEATLYCRLGEMLFTGEGCVRDERAAQAYDKLGCMDSYPRAWFQLGEHASGAVARQAMEKAVELGYGPAIRRLGMAWYEGSARLATTRSPETARRVFQKGLSLPGEDGAYCAYMLGRIYELQNERDAAVNAYRLARESGSAEAAERLAGLDWVLPPMPRTHSEERRGATGALGYCLANGATGCNRILLDSLTGRWDVTVCGDDGAALPEGAKPWKGAVELALRDLAQGVYWGGAPEFPELVIALLSDDRERNLYQAVALLGELHRLAQALGDRGWDLADKAQLYVLADRDEAGPLLDAAFAGMGAMYFRVRLCDPALDAADRLLSAAPLFLSRLRAPEDAPVRLKLIGSGGVAMALLRRAVALPLPEAAGYSIDVYGIGAEAMARKFRQLCPGMTEATAALWGPAPRFHECDPERDLIAALDGDGLADGSYYVVAVGEDGENLRLAMLLRGELTKRALEGGDMPFIAAHTRHPMAQWLAGSLPAGGDDQYDLFPFGALDMYGLRQLQEDPLERRARQAHMLVIGLPNTRDARHAAMGSYYKRQSTRDIARATALCLVYRMYLAGVSLPGWRFYGVPEEEARLGGEYTRWLKQEDHLAIATRDEHLRRNRLLLALGWAPATPEQVAAYVRRGVAGHRLYTARLDPFICPWEALENGELLAQVREAVRARFPEKSVPDPRREEEQSVRDTERLMDVGI